MCHKKSEKKKLKYEEKMLCYLCFWWGIFVWNNVNNTNKNNAEGTGNSPAIYKKKLKKYRMYHPLSISEIATVPLSEVGDV
jgi:hypothetical protein